MFQRAFIVILYIKCFIYKYHICKLNSSLEFVLQFGIILAYQSLLKSVNIEGSGKRLSITLVPNVGIVLLLGSRESLKILIHARVLKF